MRRTPVSQPVFLSLPDKSCRRRWSTAKQRPIPHLHPHALPLLLPPILAASPAIASCTGTALNRTGLQMQTQRRCRPRRRMKTGAGKSHQRTAKASYNGSLLISSISSSATVLTRLLSCPRCTRSADAFCRHTASATQPPTLGQLVLDARRVVRPLSSPSASSPKTDTHRLTLATTRAHRTTGTTRPASVAASGSCVT